MKARMAINDARCGPLAKLTMYSVVMKRVLNIFNLQESKTVGSNRRENLILKCRLYKYEI